ncbi:MAG: Lsr2 family protein [Actinomycetota bacterium]|nr:MAG: Lsr2 family protein [Actinomycetota bacterium]
MARKVQIVLTDDIDESAADETVSFTLDGVGYEIDLSAANAAKLRDDFAIWIGHARRASGSRSRSAARPARASKAAPDNVAVRAWAKSQGLAVSERGRIPADVVAKYEAEHR